MNCPYAVDTTFTVDMNGNSSLYLFNMGDFLIEDDSKIVVCGNFQNMLNTNLLSKLIRLNQDGELDPSFHYNVPPGLTNSLGVSRLTKHNGQYYIGLQTSPGVSRLFSNGSVDTSFQCKFRNNTTNWQWWTITAIYVYPDGRILLAGLFQHSGNKSEGLVRLNSDGSYDSTFHSTKVNYLLSRIHPLDNGKFLIGGYESDSVPSRNGLWRINADGTLDSSFNTGSANYSIAYYFEVLPDGKILSTGDFIIPPNNNHVIFVRWNKDGALDTSFNYFSGNGALVGFVMHDNYIVTAGWLNTNVPYRYTMALFDTLGNVDSTMFGQWGPDSTSFYQGPSTAIFRETSDGKILICGAFNSFGGHPTFGMARIYKKTVGILDLPSSSSSEFTLYPNPISSILNIEFNKAEHGSIQIFDITGKLLETRTVNELSRNYSMSTTKLTSGMYIVSFESNITKQRFNKKIIITRFEN